MFIQQSLQNNVIIIVEHNDIITIITLLFQTNKIIFSLSQPKIEFSLIIFNLKNFVRNFFLSISKLSLHKYLKFIEPQIN
jgi:hypothetical protein